MQILANIISSKDLVSFLLYSRYIVSNCSLVAAIRRIADYGSGLALLSYSNYSNIDGITGFNVCESQLIFKFMQSAVDLATSEAGLVCSLLSYT